MHPLRCRPRALIVRCGQPKGEIIVTHVEVADAGPDGEHQHVFHLKSVDRVYVLAAPTSEEKREWMDKIRQTRQIIVQEVSAR